MNEQIIFKMNDKNKTKIITIEKKTNKMDRSQKMND